MYNVKNWRYDNNRVILKIYRRNQKRIFYLSRNEMEKKKNDRIPDLILLEYWNVHKASLIIQIVRKHLFSISFSISVWFFVRSWGQRTQPEYAIWSTIRLLLSWHNFFQQWPNGKRIIFRQIPFRILCYMFIVIHSFRILMLFLVFFSQLRGHFEIWPKFGNIFIISRIIINYLSSDVNCHI